MSANELTDLGGVLNDLGWSAETCDELFRDVIFNASDFDHLNIDARTAFRSLICGVQMDDSVASAVHSQSLVGATMYHNVLHFLIRKFIMMLNEKRSNLWDENTIQILTNSILLYAASGDFDLLYDLLY